MLGTESASRRDPRVSKNKKNALKGGEGEIDNPKPVHFIKELARSRQRFKIERFDIEWEVTPDTLSPTTTEFPTESPTTSPISSKKGGKKKGDVTATAPTSSSLFYPDIPPISSKQSQSVAPTSPSSDSSQKDGEPTSPSSPNQPTSKASKK
eukprot:806111_1